MKVTTLKFNLDQNIERVDQEESTEFEKGIEPWLKPLALVLTFAGLIFSVFLRRFLLITG